MQTLPATAPNTKGFREENPPGLTMPLHILVGNHGARRENCDHRCHISSGAFPKGSFIRTGTGLTVSSPELCFVQMATELSLIELVRLGFELCGTYRLDQASEPERGFRDGRPLTSVEKLDAFIQKTPGLKGHKRARQALRHIADGSASPMETILTMLLTLPYRLGGYSFAMPRLNCPIEVVSASRGHQIRRRFKGDLYWPDARVDVEYDSDAWHVSSERLAKDSKRRNALHSAGVTVITVSRKQIRSSIAMREVAEMLSKLLRKRLQYPMPEFFQRHLDLREQLLPGETKF